MPPQQTGPARGRVTWDSEGTEGGRYHSRKLHVPSDSSGLTIGRGYDMKTKSAQQIIRDLTAAGVPLPDARVLSRASGLSGAAARRFITDNNLANFEITQAAQLLLFDISYQAEAAEARRLATKQDVVALYGATNWDGLHPAIQEMLVDLKFRGDYDGSARRIIQPSVVRNDLETFVTLMSNRENWRNVPAARFNARVAFLEAALQAHREAQARANSSSSSRSAPPAARPRANPPAARPRTPGAMPPPPGARRSNPFWR